jgi:hypothetical protein
MAAPNRSEITARVLEIEPSPQFADKWYLQIEILEARAIAGGAFARAREQARAFTFGQECPVRRDDVITASAEYLGDERGGQFQLSEITVKPPDSMPEPPVD